MLSREVIRMTSAALAAAGALCLAGCASTKDVRERGWVGGKYEDFEVCRCDALPGDRDRAVLVTQVFEDTPASTAGLRPGDLILSAGGSPTNCVEDWEECVDAAPAGETLDLELWRHGARESCAVMVGRERYRRPGLLALGLGLGTSLDLFPNPDFNILGILSYTSNDERRELRSPRERVREELGAGTHAFSLRGPESWHLWLGVVGVGRATETVAQEQTPN